MAGATRMPDAVLAEMLRRLSIAVSAGIDLRRALVAEAGRVPIRWRPVVRQIGARLADGDGFGEACDAVGGAIPEHISAMLLAGDRTGRLSEVLDETSKTIARSLTMRRALRSRLVGPAIRLALAVAVIVLVITVAGRTRMVGGPALEGPGVTPGLGAAILLGCLVVAALAAACRQGWCRRGWGRQAARSVPLVGPAIVAKDAAVWCRVAALAAHAGVGVGEMVELASRAAPGFGCDRDELEAALREGHDLAEALTATGSLPRSVIAAVAVGEATGTTAEAFDRAADEFDEAAARGLAAAVEAVGFLAWAAVALVVAVVVIRVAAAYATMIDGLTRPR